MGDSCLTQAEGMGLSGETREARASLSVCVGGGVALRQTGE